MSNTSAVAQEQTLHRESFRSDRLFYVVAESFRICRRRNGWHLGKVKEVVYDLRKMTNNSTLSRNLEQTVTRYVAWLERQVPGAWEAMKRYRRRRSSRTAWVLL